ncbi:MAG: NUDIX domain-containing protein [bacterium]|nr:NUDIX domain-containing protein [bacterium]
MKCIYCKTNDVKEIIQNNEVYFYCPACQKKSGQAIQSGGRIIQKMHSDGREKHVSVGAVIERDSKFLIAKRRVFEFGYGNIAGHVEYGETPEAAVKREVFEETGMIVDDMELFLHEDIDGDRCRRGANIHEYYYFKVHCLGNPVKNKESAFLNWYKPEEIGKLNLVYVTRYMFEKLGAIQYV